MTTSENSPPEEMKSNRRVIVRRKVTRIILTLIGICILCPASMYLIEIFPRFITLPIPPPDLYKGGLAGSWDYTIHSILVGPLATPISPGRIFLWRKETVGIYDDTHGIASSQSIVEYFDKELSRLGWVQTDYYAPCDRYLPEVSLIDLSSNQTSYVHYRRKNFKNYPDILEGDLICLVVWGNDASYSVVLLTARSSFFTILGDRIF